jgi:hypothetical protein
MNVAQSLFHEEKLQENEQEILAVLGKYGLQKLAYDGDAGRNPGYIFRGELDYPIPLQCGLEHHMRERAAAVISGDELRSQERMVLTCFLRSHVGKTAGIFYPFDQNRDPDLRKAVFWWLSLMRHYTKHFNHRTRLVDFSRDILMALYFATEQHKDNPKMDMFIYCFPCKDLKSSYDSDNNKCPFILKPGFSNMDLALGCLIELEWMKDHQGTFTQYKENRCQTWGWDRPYYANPRLASQQGMFVYPYDYPGQLHLNGPSWLVINLNSNAADPFKLGLSKTELPPTRLRISARMVNQLRSHLQMNYGISAQTVYPDRQFLTD